MDDVSVADGAPSVAVIASDSASDEDDAVAAALKAVEADEQPATAGLFSRIFGSGGAPAQTEPAHNDAQPTAAGNPPTTTDASEGGFFSGLFGGSTPQEPAAPVADLPYDPTLQKQATVVEGEAGQSVITPETTPAPQQAGFFSRLFGGGTSATKQDAEESPTPASNSGGLFGLGATPERTGPDAQLVQMNTLLPFGEIATNCEVTRRQMGTKVGEDSGYTLYDTIPNAIALRTHYITGFKDRCARQFTAATAIMGDIGTHEVVRYLPSNRSRSYSVTDNAYEDLKASFCGVAHGQPCGRRLDRFARRTVFISAYKRFASSPDWSNILLHDGRVIAMGPK